MSLTLKASELYHEEYAEFINRWELITDVIAGKEDIDEKGDTYLPIPSGRSDTEYQAYQKRAVLYNATARTMDGLLGALFRKDVKVEVPEPLEYILDNTDGEDNGVNQFSKKVATNVISKGRQGILVDFPQASGITTLREERNANMKARIQTYTPESIVNWKVVKDGGLLKLTHVLLKEEEHRVKGHAFKFEKFTRYRVLELDPEGFYFIRILEERKDEKTNTSFYTEVETIVPRLPNGELLDKIPFFFVGSIDNGAKVNKAPLYDLAQLNISHYRNSADYEEALFMIGQPTSWISGLNKDFIDENRGNIKIGSRITWLLPPESQVGLLESKADKNILQKAMELKESEMLGLGARIMQDNSSSGSESAESVSLRRSGESSQLSCIADNINKAMTEALKLCARWMGLDDSKVKYSINKEFFSKRLSHQELQALVAAWQGSAISRAVLFDNLRKGEIIDPTFDDEEIISDIEEEEPNLLIGGDLDNADIGSNNQASSGLGEIQEEG